jgi:hypothetical protein
LREPWRAGAAPAAVHEEPDGESSGISLGARGERDLLDRILHRDLRHARPSAPYGSSQEFSGRFIPGGLGGLLFDQRLPARERAVLFAVSPGSP